MFCYAIRPEIILNSHIAAFIMCDQRKLKYSIMASSSSHPCVGFLLLLAGQAISHISNLGTHSIVTELSSRDFWAFLHMSQGVLQGTFLLSHSLCYYSRMLTTVLHTVSTRLEPWQVTKMGLQRTE